MLKLPQAVLALALVVGCGAGVTTAPPKPAIRAGAVAELTISPKAMHAGEHFSARADALGLKVGKLDVTMRAPCASNPDGDWQVMADLSTSGMARWFSKTHGVSTTEVDGATFRAKRSRTHVDDGDEWRDYRVRYRPGKFSYHYTKSTNEWKKETKRVPDEAAVYDTQTAVALLRSWRPTKVGEANYFYVVIGRHLWRADVTYRGLRSVEGLKEKALLLDGTAHRVDLKPKEEYTPRSFAVWLQNSEARTPLRVSGDGSIGAVTFTLQKHDFSAPCIERKPKSKVAGPAKAGSPAAAPAVKPAAAAPVTVAPAAGIPGAVIPGAVIPAAGAAGESAAAAPKDCGCSKSKPAPTGTASAAPSPVTAPAAAGSTGGSGAPAAAKSP